MQHYLNLLFNLPVFHWFFSSVVERTSGNSENIMQSQMLQRLPFFCPTPSWTVSSPMICFNSRFSFSSLIMSRDDEPVTPSLSQLQMQVVVMPCSVAISLIDFPEVLTRSSISFFT